MQNNEQVLMESQTARNEILTDVSEERMDNVFKKVKGLVLLPDDTYVTTEMVANYYEVDVKLIEYHIKENKEELILDGLKVLKGQELKDFLSGLCNLAVLGDKKVSKIRSLTMIPKRAVLRLGMLINKSKIAKEIRTYLLNVEENSDVNTKLISITQDTNNNMLNIKSDMVKLNNIVNTITTENEELKHQVYTLIDKVDALLEQPLFKINENMSNTYEKLMLEFLDAMELIGYKNIYSNNYTMFNNEFSKWTGVDFGNKRINKKQYWISYYGIDNIKQFILGIKQGHIIKNKNGYWVSLDGIYTNKVEFNRTLEQFNHKCAYCGNDELLIAEHIIPQSDEKSTDRIYNCIPSCSNCNKIKGTMSIKEFAKMKMEQGTMTQDMYDKIQNHWEKYYIKL